MGYKANNIIARAEGLEKKDVKVFAPILDYREMEEIQDILEGLDSRGWSLTHWAVTTSSGAETGYPVFKFEG